jgi:hypothetical protein
MAKDDDLGFCDERSFLHNSKKEEGSLFPRLTIEGVSKCLSVVRKDRF